MYNYSLIQWLFIFYFYCFFGWCFESTYVSIKERKPVNRGFMRGPFLPLYGSGAVMMLLVSKPFQEHIVLVYIAGCIGATVLEYVTGVTMEALFKVRYWDYSNQPFNFQGHICLGTSLAWGLLTVLMTRFIHKPVEVFVLMIPAKVLGIVTLVLTICIVCDFALSFKAAMDLRNILVKMEKAREDMVRIQRRLDVLIAVAGEELEQRREAFAEDLEQKKEAFAEGLEQRKEAFTESAAQQREVLLQKLRVDELKESIEGSLKSLRERMRRKPADYSDEEREELLDLHMQYGLSEERRKIWGGMQDYIQRNMIRSNPTMKSLKYREAFEELKQRVSKKGEESEQPAGETVQTKKHSEQATEKESIRE